MNSSSSMSAILTDIRAQMDLIYEMIHVEELEAKMTPKQKILSRMKK